jgi:DNA-binding transcriptional MerR regulator
MELTMAQGMTISEAADALGVSAHTLRYYERAGVIDPVERAGSGHRRYGETDLERIRFVDYLRKTGMPIRRIREYFELVRQGDHTMPERLAVLERHRDAVRAELERGESYLEAIEQKISLYKEGSS